MFALPCADFDDKRYLETKTAEIENDYQKVINSILHQGLIPKHKEILVKFIASLICKTVRHQDFFKGLINDKRCKNKFLKEVSMFREGEYEILSFCIMHIDEKDKLNMVLCSLLEHLIIVLRQFNFVILKDFDNRGWFTSENPVLIDKQNHFEWIMPLEAEIYFPISRDFCLFLFNDSSEIKTNPLRNFKIDKINITDDNLHTSISNKLAHNDNEFIIFPTLIKNTLLDDLE